VFVSTFSLRISSSRLRRTPGGLSVKCRFLSRQEYQLNPRLSSASIARSFMVSELLSSVMIAELGAFEARSLDSSLDCPNGTG
jgi:hypothetical protein